MTPTMQFLPGLFLFAFSVFAQPVRFSHNPLVTPVLSSTIGKNINGPSLLEVPPWLTNPLGKYYLYFAHHNGKYIRLAYAEKLEGPWKIHEPGTLQLSETVCSSHIASPDVHADSATKKIRMYFHGMMGKNGKQVSLTAVSADGIHFTASQETLGESYFRVFQWNGAYYAMARAGILYRSRNGISDFEKGINPFDADTARSSVRHVAVALDGTTLSVFYSRIGDSPECILHSTIDLTANWKSWKISPPEKILEPELEYEGSDLALVPSISGAAGGRLRELRDPAVFRQGSKMYLLYSIAGESGIAIAELKD